MPQPNLFESASRYPFGRNNTSLPKRFGFTWWGQQESKITMKRYDRYPVYSDRLGASCQIVDKYRQRMSISDPTTTKTFPEEADSVIHGWSDIQSVNNLRPPFPPRNRCLLTSVRSAATIS